MTQEPKPTRRVTLVRSSYQPSKAELEEPIEFPDDLTPEELGAPWFSPSTSSGKDRPA